MAATVPAEAACAVTTDALQLWALARALMAQNLVQQAAQCLEALCVAVTASGATSDEEHEALLCANALLAEVYLVACGNARKSKDRELWRRRVDRAEKCIASADLALQQGVEVPAEWRLRLFKAKLLLAQTAKAERAVKNRNVLEILCEALRFCSGTSGATTDEAVIVEFRKYFGVKLKACLVKMYATTTMARAASQDAESDQFLSSLRYLRANLSDHLDREFLLKTVEEAQQLSQFGDELFRGVGLERVISPGFHTYRLILRGFFFLRTGEIKKIAPLLEEINTVREQASSDGGGKSQGLSEPYLESIVDALRLSVVSCTDPCEALILSMAGIHSAQANLRNLQSLQCRYFEMGASIAQMVEIFALYKAHLLPTVYYRFFLARIHLLIAKYAVAIGRVKEACSHLNYIVEKLLPRADADSDQYPDVYLAIWVGTLEVGTYCSPSSVGSEATEDDSSPMSVSIKQIYPNKVLLEWTARVLEREKLRDRVYECCNVELRAKYDLALSKWLWATQELAGIPLSEGSVPDDLQPLTGHGNLEALRPKMLPLLRETLERMSKHVNCCETTAEVLALFGSKLVGLGRADNGEETLKNAIRLGLHSKNVLLQARLLVDVFRLYRQKHHVHAQTATVAKFEKKVAVLNRRVAAAQAEATTNAAILRWTSGAATKSEKTTAK